MKNIYTVSYNEKTIHASTYIIQKTIKTIIIAENAKEAREIVAKRYGYEIERLTARKQKM